MCGADVPLHSRTYPRASLFGNLSGSLWSRVASGIDQGNRCSGFCKTANYFESDSSCSSGHSGDLSF